MRDLTRWREELVREREAVSVAEGAASTSRWQLTEARAALTDALRTGDIETVARAEEEHARVERLHRDAVRRVESLRERGFHRLVDGVEELRERLRRRGDAELGVDAALPIALLPVRLETRFAGTDASPVLQVRIYPDDVHVDDHEPDLSPEEDAAGRTYWTSLLAGGAEAEAWAALAGSVGPHRALWVRERLQPTDGALPEPSLRPPGTSRATVARGLPDLFLVRVRVGSWSHIEVGSAVADTLQLGPDLSGLSTLTPPDGAESTLLGEETRWLTEFPAAVAAGMGVEVSLPADTREVTDVTVTGVSLSLDPDSAGALVEELVTTHRVTHGAGFVAPGTPTNNLADSTSGWASRVDPARLDPAARPTVGAGSNADVLARALGVRREALAGLVGAEDRDAAESEVMARALFEATWGPYLRDHAQPGFPLALLPLFHGHATRWVRGGGPLPCVRLGRQPYGVLPVQPRGGWKAAGDDQVSSWLADYLPRVRSLWLAGERDVPAGVTTYSHEPVSTRFRVRTANASATGPVFEAMGFDTGGGKAGVQERRLVAELGLGDVVPWVTRTLFAKGAVDLWLPMSDEHDLDFLLVAPNPKEATSVLGLLLRNACLQMSDHIADQLISPIGDVQLQGLVAQRKPVLHLEMLSEVAVSATPEVAVGPQASMAHKLATQVVTEAGAQTTVQGYLEEVLEDAHGVAVLDRYWHLDAFRTFGHAHKDLEAIPPERRARLAGEVLDCASHRYDAWVTSLATRRLAHLRTATPTGLQLGAWGIVQRVRRRTLPVVTGRTDLPEGTARDEANRGFVLAPSLQHADAAGVLRAAWLARGGRPGDPEAPFAVDLRSERLRQALTLADGMRNGQQLGALLGYLLERDLHESSGAGAEVDWAVFVLRRLFPLRVDSAEDAGLSAERLVVDGWRTAQRVLEDAAEVLGAVMAELPAGLDADRARSAIRTSLERLVGALDGLMDLGLAESVHQLAGADFARAAAATDMVGRADVPPDAFDVAGTSRGGQGLEQRLVVLCAGLDRPAGWAGTTPRARLAPEADAFVARRLGSPTGTAVRLLGEDGAEVARADLADLGLAALDLAADAASHTDAAPFPLLLDRVRRVTTTDDATTALGLDPEADGDLVDLLEHAARWHAALAGRRPMSAATFEPRGGDVTGDLDGGALAAVLESADALEAETPSAERVAFWGLDPRLGPTELEAARRRRVAAARAAGDAGDAAKALLGGACVVTGVAPVAAPWEADPDARGRLVGWLQDTGRVRDAAHALDEALLHGELREPDGDDGVGLSGVEGPVTVVAVHEHGTPDPGELVGVELDAWVEVVPDRDGAGAVAANLASPDSRAPNTILLAVPADVDAPWTREGLFSVVDEALELARCRLVDLDASRRVPGVLPAIYIHDFDDTTSWRDKLRAFSEFPDRFVAKGTSL